MELFEIKGKVVYQKIGTGFWGIIDHQNRKWRPVHMPEPFRKEGLEISVKAKKITGEASIFMWGSPVELVGI